MPGRAFPGLGIIGGYSEGEGGWANDMNENLRKLSALSQLSAASATTTLPTTGSTGDVYIVPSGAGTNANHVAIWDDGAWVYFSPGEGWRAYLRDDNKAVVYTGSAWVDDTPSGVDLVSAIDAQLGGTDWQGPLTGAEIVAALDAQLGGTDWQGPLTGAEIVAALDAQLGSTDWQGPLTGAEIVAALDAQLGSTDWQTGGSAGSSLPDTTGALEGYALKLDSSLNAVWAPDETGGSSLPDDSTASSGDVLTTDGAGTFTWTTPASGGGSSGLAFVGEVPSYDTVFSKGDRTSIITITASFGFQSGTIDEAINGSYANDLYWQNGLSVAGENITFDFGEPVCLEELNYYHSTSQFQGTWKFQCSDDGTTWTDASTDFVLTGSPTGTANLVDAHDGSFKRYWRLLGVSGTSTSVSWLREFDFKVGQGHSGVVQVGKLLEYDSTNDAITGKGVKIERETATGYTVTEADLSGQVLKEIDNLAAVTVTIPAGLTGTEPVIFEQVSSGGVTFAADTGVTINSFGGALALTGQNATAVLIPKGSDVFTLAGNIS